ncbi:hypothetical protein C8J56DRAFT_940793 [Mycena floridula]|nr:hypothetical protein C8J56DRAFT_940793 [Mycena floridula]
MIQPLLYRVVELYRHKAAELFRRTVSSTSLGLHVKALLLGIDTVAGESIIFPLKNFQSLAECMLPSALLYSKPHLHSLSRLCLVQRSRFACQASFLLLPPSLAHLELYYFVDPEPLQPSWLNYLHQLEHLALYTQVLIRLNFEFNRYISLSWLLEIHDPRIIFVVEEEDTLPMLCSDDALPYIVVDPGQSANWGYGRTGEKDIWELAEEAQKRLASKRRDVRDLNDS